MATTHKDSHTDSAITTKRPKERTHKVGSPKKTEEENPKSEAPRARFFDWPW